MNNKSEYKIVSADQVQPGPRLRDNLPPDLYKRVERYHTILEPIDKQPLAVRVDLFCRDRDPESEVWIWERITAAYIGFISIRELTIDQKKEVYYKLLIASTFEKPDPVVLAEGSNFSVNEIIELLNMFYAGFPSRQIIQTNNLLK
jgi:hypothetical protein